MHDRNNQKIRAVFLAGKLAVLLGIIFVGKLGTELVYAAPVFYPTASHSRYSNSKNIAVHPETGYDSGPYFARVNEEHGKNLFQSEKQTKSWSAVKSNQLLAASGATEEDPFAAYDFGALDEQLKAGTNGSTSLTFQELVKMLVKGDAEGSIKGVLSMVLGQFLDEIAANQKILIQLAMVAVIAAVFTNFTTAFSNAFIGEAGFFVTYLIIFMMVVGSYMLALQVTREVIENVLLFMQALIPAYSIAVTMASGITSSMALYEGLMIAITVAQYVMLYVVIPLTNVYFLMALVNNLEKEDRFTKLIDLVKSIVDWTMKTIMAVIIGFQLIQGLLLPAIDSVKNTALQKGIGAIPGAGGAMATVISTMVGSGVVIKNSIGIAGLIGILLVVLVPVLKLVVFVLGYRLTAALLQPVSDKRIVNCIHCTAKGAKILLDSVVCVSALFMVCLALIAATTNVRYYAG